MSQPADQPHEKKIIIDEDWKSRVQAEKEAAEKPPAQGDEAAKAKPARPKGPLPPPTLTLLATSLGMQAMIAMGVIPSPVDNKPNVDLDQAKHLIDTIDMLWQKSEGNRTADETATLDGLLHELRMAYVTLLGER
jgi:hypothetical protein